MSTATATAQPEETSTYEEKPTLKNVSTVSLQAAGVGLVASAIQNAVSNHSAGGWGVITRSGHAVGFFAAMGATFAFADSFVANQRQKDDALNGVAGGCAAGFLAGIRARSLPMAVTSCAILGGIVGAYDYTGQLTGGGDGSVEEKRRRFFKHPRQPLESTTSE